MNSTPPGQATVRAFASLANGVHAVSREQVTEWLRPKLTGGEEASEAPLIWLDISNPGEAEAVYLRDTLGLHPLAVEDCIRGRQRPKIDRYAGYLFLVIYAASINRKRHRMALNEIHLFLGENFLITVHDHKVEEVGETVARWRASPRRLHDVGALAHLLLDAIVDDYFPVLEYLAERTDHMESSVFHDGEDLESPQILMLRHELVLFRRVLGPQRDVVSTLLRRDLPTLKPELLPYFQDVYDHIVRVAEEIDVLRELLSALLEAQMSTSTNQLNQTMRMLTAWSIILMSMALVAGIYGMNFALMPELQWRWGYAFALGVMAAIGSGLVVFFRRQGWL